MFSVNNKIDVNLSLSLDYAVSKQTCLTVLEALLKYILCQRHLIPIQMDILTKEIQMEPSLDIDYQMDDDLLSEIDTKAKIRRMVLQRRQISRRQSYFRRRKHWKTKVTKFLEKYGIISQTIKDEMQNCRLKEVMFLLGASPYSAREVYRVHLPESYEAERSNETTTYDRKTLRHMLRTFTASEDLSNLVNRRLPMCKLWVMVLKDSGTFTEADQASFVPKLGYSIPTRANCVNVHILGENPTTPMDLTPTTNGTIYYIGKASRKELFSQVNPQESDVLYNTFPDLGVVPLADCPHLDREWLKRLSAGQAPLSKKPKIPQQLSRICNSPMQETPIVGNRPYVTPSPIRALVRGVENIDVTSDTSSDVWFQSTHSLTGFRDFWPVNCS